jgi:hypothetical protein
MRIRFFGICVLVFSAASFARGFFKFEAALELAGAVFFILLLYCFVAMLLCAALHSKKARQLSARIAPRAVKQGEVGTILLNDKARFFSLPAILIRYQLQLETIDHKKITHIFEKDFFVHTVGNFLAARRGAYYGKQDCLLIQDIFGFFYLPLKIEQDRGERLLALPQAAETAPRIESFSGGADMHSEKSIIKSDDLLDQRPYIPGDDPRRINWKLYSHAGELFVRLEEMQPPPHSRLALIVDTEVDAALFSHDEGVKAVDDLCAAALAIALECAAHNVEIELGWNGCGALKTGNMAQISEYLAYPASLAMNSTDADGARRGGKARGNGSPAQDGRATALPDIHSGAQEQARSILALALPFHSSSEKSALAVFLNGLRKDETADLFFCYTNATHEGAAAACALRFYNKKGVHAKSVKL